MTTSSDLFNEIIPLGRLIHMVNQHTDRLLGESLAPYGITATQFKVLCSINCQGSIAPVELKKRLSVDLGALTRMLDRLASRAWITRLPNPQDKRGILVTLTPAGRDLCVQCHREVGTSLHQELTKNLSEPEVETLYRLLTKTLP